MSTANIAFAQSPPGIGRKRPSLPGQPLGDRASAVPFGCRKCFPLAEIRNSYLRLTDPPSCRLLFIDNRGHFLVAFLVSLWCSWRVGRAGRALIAGDLPEAKRLYGEVVRLSLRWNSTTGSLFVACIRLQDLAALANGSDADVDAALDRFSEDQALQDKYLRYREFLGSIVPFFSP